MRTLKNAVARRLTIGVTSGAFILGLLNGGCSAASGDPAQDEQNGDAGAKTSASAVTSTLAASYSFDSNGETINISIYNNSDGTITEVGTDSAGLSFVKREVTPSSLGLTLNNTGGGPATTGTFVNDEGVSFPVTGITYYPSPAAAGTVSGMTFNVPGGVGPVTISNLRGYVPSSRTAEKSGIRPEEAPVVIGGVTITVTITGAAIAGVSAAILTWYRIHVCGSQMTTCVNAAAAAYTAALNACSAVHGHFSGSPGSCTGGINWHLGCDISGPNGATFTCTC